MKENAIKTRNTSYLIKSFLPYFKKYKGILAMDLFCAALTSICDLVLPMIVRYLTDIAATDVSQLTVQLILSVGALYLVLRVIDMIANYYMANIGHVMGAKIETDMRKDLFEHLQDLSYSYYNNTKVGQLMARITSDLFDVYDVFDRRRPLPVNGITVPEDFDLQALADSLGMSDRIIN